MLLFISNKIKLVHFYNVPHLIKFTRNNKDLTLEMNGQKHVTEWQHLLQVYNADSCVPDSKLLPRLTKNHVMADKIYKIKVHYATQMFSQRVSAVLNYLACELIDFIMSCVQKYFSM